MALNVPGLIMMLLFYALVFGVGVWVSIRSKRERDRGGDTVETTFLANRRVNLLMGIFTMTGDVLFGVIRFNIRLELDIGDISRDVHTSSCTCA